MTFVMFPGSGKSMAPSGRIDVEIGNEEIKIAAAKPDVPVSQLLYKIAKKFQRLFAYFRGQGSEWCCGKGSTSKPGVRISKWWL
jgi:hypothetical protein